MLLVSDAGGQVYLPAIVGYVPTQMVQAIAAFLDACYIARRADLDETSIKSFEDAVEHFHQLREIFRTTGVRPTGFSLPRQHSLVHYSYLAREFGAPGGICSSITESRHITAVKRPWRRSNRYEALGQMLLTNQRLDKLAAARVDFVRRGMLIASYNAPLAPVLLPHAEDDDEGPVDEIVTGNVTLARTRGELYISLHSIPISPRFHASSQHGITPETLLEWQTTWARAISSTLPNVSYMTNSIPMRSAHRKILTKMNVQSSPRKSISFTLPLQLSMRRAMNQGSAG